MNPLAIMMTVGAAAGLVAFVGYLTYQVFNANEPHRSNHSRSESIGVFESPTVGKCTICLREISVSQMMTLRCNHMFHRVCIDIWKRQPGNAVLYCPNCEICTICFDAITTTDHRRTLKCKHVFHQKCIDRWLRVQNKCPNCKKAV